MQKGSKNKYVEITKGSLIAKSCPEDQNFIVTRIVSFDYKTCQVVDVEDDTPFNCTWDQVCAFDKKLQFTEPTECYAIWNGKWDPEGTQIEDAWTTTYYKATVFPGMKNKKTEYVVAFAGNEQMKCRVPVVIKYSPLVEFPGVIRGEPATKHPAVLALFPGALTLPLPPEKRARLEAPDSSSESKIQLAAVAPPPSTPLLPPSSISAPSSTTLTLPIPAHTAPTLAAPASVPPAASRVAPPSAAPVPLSAAPVPPAAAPMPAKPKKLVVAPDVPLAERHLLRFPQVATNIRLESPAFNRIGPQDAEVLDFPQLKATAEAGLGRVLSEEEALGFVQARLGYRSSLGLWHRWDAIRQLPSKQLAVAPYVALW